ncbi:LysR family transcriptional regulator [Alloscardovia macacae]|uniref:LysR family transcriptional regulator n=1 Tax=Alloscardovia macacae TaxID=1160091 RepID=A0A261F581_9BIFI|nr:LysR family transcriptional regulator [Alloscardovia macacae]OZG54056.1 LysR family transcriptional regulator [Alloscardovia macacae]
MVNTADLRQLVTFARKGTLSAAARELHMSQPSLTRTMHRLEAEFKVSLFDRNSGSVALNATGQLAVQEAERVIELHDQMLERVRAFYLQQRSISILSCAPLPLTIVERIIANAYPDLTIQSALEEDEDVVLQAIEPDAEGPAGAAGAHVDLTIVRRPLSADEQKARGLVCVPVLRETLYLSVPKDHLLAQRESLHFSDFNGYSIILRPDIGFWMDVVRQHLPASQLLVQQDAKAFHTIAAQSDFFYFSTSAFLAMADEDNPLQLPGEHRPDPSRAFIKILDEDATSEFYCVCRAEQLPALGGLLREVQTAGKAFER